jgi:hypothetical protein
MYYPDRVPLEWLDSTMEPCRRPAQNAFPNVNERVFEHSGQIAPVGMRPTICACLLQEEATVVFQVVVNGIIVGRRKDNQYVNVS